MWKHSCRNPTQAQQIVLVESIAGDSVIAHTTAFCAGVESLSGVALALRDHALRSVAAELERIAMHLSTFSGVSIDIGFALPAAAIGNLRTLAINLTAEHLRQSVRPWLDYSRWGAL